MRPAHRGGDRLVGHLTAHQHRVDRARPLLERALDLRRGHRRVGSGRDDDLVLARAVDRDHRHAGRRVVAALHERDVHPAPGQRGECAVAALVRADRADHRDRCTEPRGRGRRVRALAALVLLEVRAEHRLAGRRKPIDGDDEVVVDGADDEQPAAHRPSASRASISNAQNRSASSDVATLAFGSLPSIP